MWWHLRTGALIAASGVPHADPYSFTAAGREWIDHEWAIQWLMAALRGAGGYPAVAILFGLLQAAQLFLLHRLLRDRGCGRLPTLVLLLAHLSLAAPTWGVRPQIVGPLLAACELWLLEGWRRGRLPPWALAGLPALMLLWTNVHGSSAIAPALVATYLAGNLLGRMGAHGDGRRSWIPLAAALAGTIAAAACNPYGTRLFSLTPAYAGIGRDAALQAVMEWRAPSIEDPASCAFFVCIALLLVLALRSRTTPDRRRIDPTDVLLTLGFTAAALRATYFLPYFGIGVLPILGGAIASLRPSWSRSAEAVPLARDALFCAAVTIAGALAIPAALLSSPLAQTRAEPRTDTKIPYPAAALDTLARWPAGARVYNEFAWGGYLIDRAWPRVRVFVDGRIDVYRGPIFDDYLRIRDLEPGWREKLARYDVAGVLIASGSRLDEALADDSAWCPEAKDAIGSLYRRRDGTSACDAIQIGERFFPSSQPGTFAGASGSESSGPAT